MKTVWPRAASAGGNEVIYTVTLNPALDKTVEIPDFTLDAVNRITTLRTDPGGKEMCIRDRYSSKQSPDSCISRAASSPT